MHPSSQGTVQYYTGNKLPALEVRTFFFPSLRWINAPRLWIGTLAGIYPVMTDHRAISSSLVTVGDAHSEGCRRPLLHTVALGQLILALILSLFFFSNHCFLFHWLAGDKGPGPLSPPTHSSSLNWCRFFLVSCHFFFFSSHAPTQPPFFNRQQYYTVYLYRILQISVCLWPLSIFVFRTPLPGSTLFGTKE